MGQRIELVVTDLDGTLWHHPDHVPDRTRAALGELRRRGQPILVATGRRVGSTRDALGALGWAPPAVVLNGGIGLDLATAERFHLGGFPPAEAAAVLATFVAHGVVPCVYVDHDRWPVRVGEGPSTHPGHLASFGDEVCVDTLEAVVAAHRVFAFGVLGIDAAVADALGAALAGVGVSHVSPDRQWGGHTVTVAPRACSKWDGVLAYCNLAGLDPGTVLAIGDGPNDVELLAGAAVAVVPDDAHPAARAHAHHVVARAADGGWADLLDLL